MQCSENGPFHTGDSDDEIAELRIQALLTKRENEAEVSKPNQNSYSQLAYPPPHSNTMSGYPQHYGNSYNNNYCHRPFYRHNPYHPNFAGKTVNSSNIVVLTSSDNEHSSMWKAKENMPQKSVHYQPPVGVVNKIESVNSTSKLILPQDKYSRPPPKILSNNDKPKQMSARMKRLQGSDSESDSDSSSDSSTSSSSSSGSSSSSDSSSNEDSESENGNKVIKYKKIEKGKDHSQNILSILDENKSKSSNKEERQTSPKKLLDMGIINETDTKISKALPSLSPMHDTLRTTSISRTPLRKSRSRTPLRRRSKSPRFKSGLSKFGSRSPRMRPWSPPRGRSRSPRIKHWSPTEHTRSPRLRSRSPRFRQKSPLRRSRSPRLRPLSPRYRSKSPLRRSKSPYKRMISPWKRTIASDRRSYSPILKSYRRSRSPYQQNLTKLSQRIGSRSPRFRSRLSRSPISPKVRRQAPFRSRSRSPLPRGNVPFARKRSIPRLRTPSPYSRRRSPGLRSVSPRLPRHYSPAKAISSIHGTRVMSPHVPRPLSPRFKRDPSPLRQIPSQNFDAPYNLYLSKASSRVPNINNNPGKITHCFPPARSPPFQGGRGKIPVVRSQSPIGRTDFYKENYDYPEYRKAEPHFPPNYITRREPFESPRNIYPAGNGMQRSMSPWSREQTMPNFAPNTFEHPSPNLRNSRPKLLMLPGKEVATVPNIPDVRQRFPFRGRGRLLSNNPYQSDRQPRGHMNPPLVVKREQLDLPDNPPIIEQGNVMENTAQNHPSNHTISPFIDPSISYKNRAGERHIPYSLFENELSKNVTNPFKNEHSGDTKQPQVSNTKIVERIKPMKEKPGRSRLPEESESKHYSSTDSKRSRSNPSAKRNGSKISGKGRVNWDRSKSTKDSIKNSKAQEEDNNSSLSKKTSKIDNGKNRHVSADTKRISTERSKVSKVDIEKPIVKGIPRSKETSPKVKAPKGPRTPSYSPENEPRVKQDDKWDNRKMPVEEITADVTKDLADLAQQRIELERKLKEEEALIVSAARDEEERSKNAKIKEERVMADRAKEDKLEIERSKKGKLESKSDKSNELLTTNDVARNELDSYNIVRHAEIDKSFEVKIDRRSDSKYTLQSDFFNISDTEFGRRVSLEEPGEIVVNKKKLKKEKVKSKKKKSKDKNESKHKKVGREKKKKRDRKKKKKKDKKEHREKPKKKDKIVLMSPNKITKSETSKRIQNHKMEETERSNTRPPSSRDLLATQQSNRRNDFTIDKTRKRKRNDSRERTRNDSRDRTRNSSRDRTRNGSRDRTRNGSRDRTRNDSKERNRIEERLKIDHESEKRRKGFNKEETKKAILVTVGKGADRRVTSGKTSFKANYKPSNSSEDSSRLPVHMRLGPSKGNEKESKSNSTARTSSGGRKHDDRRRR